ncbi:TRAP transporter substrate-binding protein [Balneatrix alpica]|uniref:TRAP transporter substrate-binding protein n=1 Tax=Balneatrix alpica TaxID=75684 RepID=A0ABV5ZD40_9GAMM|nr:TRAP transporter substrate-binding protein [Balneatrix alpica]
MQTRTPRLTFTAMLSALGLSATLLASSVQAATTWDMPTPYGDKTFHTENIREFAKEVAEASAGELQITVHSNGSLIKHPEIKNAVRKGLVPIGELIMSRLANEDALFEVDSVPFLATNYDEAWKLWQASKQALSTKLEAQGLQLLFAVPWPPQGIYTKFPVNQIEDLAGVKMRAYNESSETLAVLLGSVPTQVEVPDIPTAFSTGRVDAMITSPSTGVNSKAWDFLSDFNHAQLWLPKNMVIVNAKAFKRLDADTQAKLLKAAETAEQRGWEMSRQETAKMLDELKANGIKVSEPNADLTSDLKKVGAQMEQNWLENAGAEGQAVLDAYRQ